MSSTRLQTLLSGTSGRFFSLRTRHGEAINAQTVSVTPCFVNLVDNNTGRSRRILHSDVASVKIGGRVYTV